MTLPPAQLVIIGLQYGLVLAFLDAYVVIFVMLFVFNLIDLLVVDWLLFVTIQPGFIVLPGTEGMPGYKDYGFHFKSFLKGLLGSAIGSLILAGLAWVFGVITF